MTGIDPQISPDRILIIKPSALGDVVHTLPILNLLRRKWPKSHITWLIGSAYVDLVRGHPQLDAVIEFDRTRFGRWWRDPLAAGALGKFVLDLIGRHFDLVI